MAMGWVEQRVARERAAIAFLNDRGFAVNRVDGASPIARYWVSGWRGDVSGPQLIEIADQNGFRADASAADGALGAPPLRAPAVPPEPTATPSSPAEETTVTQVTATINLFGETANSFRSFASAHDLTQGLAARQLIEQALAATPVDGPDGQAAPADLAEVDTDELLDELSRRFAAASRAADVERDLAEANERASAAEARLAAIAAAMNAPVAG